jgi:thiol-disulfide isomerase/thioredoxin
MILRRTRRRGRAATRARALIFGASVLLAVSLCVGALPVRATAPGDGIGPDPRARKRPPSTRRHAPRKRAARRARNRAQPATAALPLLPTQLIDAAGMKQLLARGTPPNDRPLLVNFWATWCEPCREEFPDLIKINRDYSARGLEFVAISVDDPSEAATGVPRFLREMGATMPAYILNVTDSEPIINAVDPTWGGELPATFLFDRQGRVVFQHKGRVKPAALRTALDKVTSEQ